MSEQNVADRVWVVCRLQKTVTMDIGGGKEKEVALEGCRGYLPVFSTRDEAVAHSSDGKFQILAMEITNGAL